MIQYQETNFSFAKRMEKIPKSFIREILKVTSNPEVISFAGGLPNPDTFPHDAIRKATEEVLTSDSASVLQYTTTEGYLPLREYLASWYAERGIILHPDELLITNGSQQGLDLCGKLFLDPDDGVVIESPGYLGAIQAFSAYEPDFLPLPMEQDGINTKLLEEVLWDKKVKLIYLCPSFQNPTGILYSDEKRREVADILRSRSAVLVEDDPYGEIRFEEKRMMPIKKYLPDRTILLGSFSKIIAPGLRLGWVAAHKDIIEKMVVAKQATDLHSNHLSQRIVYTFLTKYDMNAHLKKICLQYKEQKDYMMELIQKYFPEEVRYYYPQGGMFIWIIMPDYIDAFRLLQKATEFKVAFVPGGTFYTADAENNTMRLNFSNTNKEKMEVGIQRLGKLLYTEMCNP